MLRVQRRPAVVFLISDLLASDFERPLRLAAKRHDLVVLEVVDPLERCLPNAGMVLIEDAETGARRLIDTSSSKVRAALATEAERRREATRAAVLRAGADLLPLDTSLPYDKPLLRYFRERARRIRR